MEGPPLSLADFMGIKSERRRKKLLSHAGEPASHLLDSTAYCPIGHVDEAGVTSPLSPHLCSKPCTQKAHLLSILNNSPL